MGGNTEREHRAATKLQAQQRGARARAADNPERLEAVMARASRLEAEAQALFVEADTDSSGYLGYKELTRLIRDLMKKAGVRVKLNMSAFDEFFAEADADGSSNISFDEFVEWYNHFLDYVRRAKSEETEQTPSRAVGELVPTQAEAEQMLAMKQFRAQPHERQADPTHEEQLRALFAQPVHSYTDDERRRITDAFMAAVERPKGAKGVKQRKVEGARQRPDTATLSVDTFRRVAG